MTEAESTCLPFPSSSGGNYGENLVGGSFFAPFLLTFGKAAGTDTTYGIVDAVSDWMSEACKIISL